MRKPSPEKLIICSAAILQISALVLFVVGVARDRASLRQVGLITFGIAFAIASIPLTGFLIMSGIEKLRGK